MLNELRRAKRLPRSHQFVQLEGEGVDDSGLDQSATLCDPSPGPEEEFLRHEMRELIRTSLNAVTDARHREAIILRFEQGWPITHKDPAIPTLRAHFDVSARQIQNWIDTAISEMRKAIGEQS